jgi:hypothetical protein
MEPGLLRRKPMTRDRASSRQASRTMLGWDSVYLYYRVRLENRLLGIVFLGVLVTGCGLAKPVAPTANLEGMVTLDGRPIDEGTIQFMPATKGQAAPSMAVISEGRYVATGVPRGKVQVLLSATRKTGKMITTYSEPYEEAVSIIPEKYQSGIEINVAGDDPKRNFELKSR